MTVPFDHKPKDGEPEEIKASVFAKGVAEDLQAIFRGVAGPSQAAEPPPEDSPLWRLGRMLHGDRRRAPGDRIPVVAALVLGLVLGLVLTRAPGLWRALSAPPPAPVAHERPLGVAVPPGGPASAALSGGLRG